jgi:hypothetical protein
MRQPHAKPATTPSSITIVVSATGKVSNHPENAPGPAAPAIAHHDTVG